MPSWRSNYLEIFGNKKYKRRCMRRAPTEFWPKTYIGGVLPLFYGLAYICRVARIYQTLPPADRASAHCTSSKRSMENLQNNVWWKHQWSESVTRSDWKHQAWLKLNGDPAEISGVMGQAYWIPLIGYFVIGAINGVANLCCRYPGWLPESAWRVYASKSRWLGWWDDRLTGRKFIGGFVRTPSSDLQWQQASISQSQRTLMF